jgi:transcriptional regulator of nitric oxide reductase
LFQEAINPFTVVIALDKTNQIILTMIDHHETIEVQDIPETILVPVEGEVIRF